MTVPVARVSITIGKNSHMNFPSFQITQKKILRP